MAEAAENILQYSMKGSDFYIFLSNQWELQRFINIYYNNFEYNKHNISIYLEHYSYSMCFYFCSVWSKHTDPLEDKENANSKALNKRPKT